MHICTNDKIHAYLQQFRVLSKDELKPGIHGGTTFTSVCFNTALYLPWLASQCLKQGVVLRRGIANHITDAATMHHTGKRADLLINCTGLSSLKLGGVEDTALYPGTLRSISIPSTPTDSSIVCMKGAVRL
jgi:D-amino-acid oxidase